MAKFILVFLCVFIGYMLAIVLAPRKDPIGNLHVDNSDPDGTHLFLEITCDPNVLENESYVLLKVDKSNYLSQE